jgi:hypothetical protein
VVVAVTKRKGFEMALTGEDNCRSQLRAEKWQKKRTVLVQLEKGKSEQNQTIHCTSVKQ